jgi:hypothetical protein
LSFYRPERGDLWLNELCGVCDALEFMAHQVCAQQGATRHLVGVASTLHVLQSYLNIPRQSEQGFHGKKNTNSTAKLMPIPRQKEQGFHAIANRISGWRRRGSTVARSTVLSGVPNGKCQVDHAQNQGSAAAAFRV